MVSAARIAVVDSGVAADHPHIRGCGELIAGPTIGHEGRAVSVPHTDRLGHGTAVSAAILDLAPGATIYSIRVFVEDFTCSFESVLAAINAAIEWRPHWINLSLGTTCTDWCRALDARIDRAHDVGAKIVAPASASGLPSYPGSLEGTEAVVVDPNVTRAAPERREIGGRGFWFASPHPRAIEDVPRDANWSGVSFAVANVTGCLARDR